MMDFKDVAIRLQGEIFKVVQRYDKVYLQFYLMFYCSYTLYFPIRLLLSIQQPVMYAELGCKQIMDGGKFIPENFPRI